tara:strand:- start:6299 stop:7192 length:894 start_codon:yes stop_codon:yes gene_type:complete
MLNNKILSIKNIKLNIVLLFLVLSVIFFGYGLIKNHYDMVKNEGFTGSTFTTSLCNAVNNKKCELEKKTKCKLLKEERENKESANRKRLQYESVFNKRQNNLSYLCDKSVTCLSGCVMPTTINENKCHPRIFTNTDGSKFRMCNYVCDTSNANRCRFDICCKKCGYVKFNIDENGDISGNGIKVPYINDIVDEQENVDDISSDITVNITGGNNYIGYNDNHYRGYLSGRAGRAPTLPPRSKCNGVTSSNLKEAYDSVIKTSQHTRKYPCRSSITGMFTECGPEPNKGLTIGFSEFYK